MITSFPASLAPSGPARSAAPTPIRILPAAVAPGSWRYDARGCSRRTVVFAALISASLHAGLLFGVGHTKKKIAPPVAAPTIQLTLAIPEVKELEEPEPVTNDDARRSEESFAPVPMQADLPQLPQPSDFVQQIDFASLIERPDFSQLKLFSVPENFRGGTSKLVQNIGAIFNLADLDRIPEAVFQPAPVFPAAMRRDGLECTLIVEFIVDTNGRAVDAIIVESRYSGFNDAAIAGVQKWKFRPGIRGGRKVNTRMRVPINFTLANELN